MEKTVEFLKDNVRYYRNELKLSQQELAERCDLSTTYIAEIEIGRRYPSLKSLIKIATAFDIDTYRLLLDPQKHKSDIVDNFSKILLERITEDIEDLKSRY